MSFFQKLNSECKFYFSDWKSGINLDTEGKIFLILQKAANLIKKKALNISTVQLPVKSSLSDILSWQDCSLISPSFPTEPTVNPFVSGVNSFQARQIRSLNTLWSTFYKIKAYLIGPLHESFRKCERLSKIMLRCW